MAKGGQYAWFWITIKISKPKIIVGGGLCRAQRRKKKHINVRHFCMSKCIFRENTYTMLLVDSRRKKPETLLRQHPGALLIDVTSHADGPWQRLSPFFPPYGIPVPFSPGVTSASLEGVWQGLKDFEHEDIDPACFANDTMHGLKRTVATHGRCLGHRKGVQGHELLSYAETDDFGILLATAQTDTIGAVTIKPIR